jgi:hypothetical protein
VSITLMQSLVITSLVILFGSLGTINYYFNITDINWTACRIAFALVIITTIILVCCAIKWLKWVKKLKDEIVCRNRI